MSQGVRVLRQMQMNINVQERTAPCKSGQGCWQGFWTTDTQQNQLTWPNGEKSWWFSLFAECDLVNKSCDLTLSVVSLTRDKDMNLLKQVREVNILFSAQNLEFKTDKWVQMDSVLITVIKEPLLGDMYQAFLTAPESEWAPGAGGLFLPQFGQMSRACIFTYIQSKHFYTFTKFVGKFAHHLSLLVQSHKKFRFQIWRITNLALLTPALSHFSHWVSGITHP